MENLDKILRQIMWYDAKYEVVNKKVWKDSLDCDNDNPYHSWLIYSPVARIYHDISEALMQTVMSLYDMEYLEVLEEIAKMRNRIGWKYIEE